jgi:hypothetical protein
MSEFAVPTTSLPILVWMSDGRMLDGEVFLPSESPYRDGPMLLDEWAALAPAFVPLREADGHVSLVSRAHVVAFALPVGIPATAEEELVDAPIRHVVVETLGGQRFEGNVAIAMPRAQQRLNDWMNTTAPYVVLDVGGRAHLISKARIVRIVERGEA